MHRVIGKHRSGNFDPVRVGTLVSLLAMASVVTLSRAAFAADYYVDGTNGSDSSNGSEGTPFRTIRKSIEVMGPGDTVYIRGGTYSGWENQINPTTSGTQNAWITFRNYEGELPIIEPPPSITGGSAFEPQETAVQYIRVQGLVARNWPSSGFSNGWNFPANNIEIRYCIADNNGINGIAFYKATGVLIEHSIALHNGNRDPSYSSGFNLFDVGGSATNNIVRGNVSFENIDICGSPPCSAATSTDGNGFILDEGSTGALFDSNIAFRNGGSCLRLTNSSGAELINNSCFHNGLDTGYEFVQAEIYFSDDTSRSGAVVRNNVAVASSGLDAINSAGSASLQNNLFVDDNGSASFFVAPVAANPDFRPTSSATQLIDQGSGTGVGSVDIGFDPKCIRQQTGQAVSWWQHALDYDYIASVGGVAGCFHPTTRTQGAAVDIGAYEYTSTSGCSSVADCNDDNACTTDSCGGTGQCNHAPIQNCCQSPLDCDDGDTCTTDSCNSSSLCEHTPVTGCCATVADCNDANACTSDTCDTNTSSCSHQTLENCCTADGECDDGDACTVDSCALNTHACTTFPVSNCCTTDTACSTPSACLTASCDTATNTCSTAPVAGCCSAASDCDDANPCTTDSCDAVSGNCSNLALTACCQLDGDCIDSDPCSVDSCDPQTNSCSNVRSAGCCTLDGDCTAGALGVCDLNLNQCSYPAPDGSTATTTTAAEATTTGSTAGDTGTTGNSTTAASTGATTSTTGTSGMGGTGSVGTAATNAGAPAGDSGGCACSLPRDESTRADFGASLLGLLGLLYRRRRPHRSERARP